MLMRYFADDQRPLATGDELRDLYKAALDPDRVERMSTALDVLADLSANAKLFPVERTTRALAEHGFEYSHSAKGTDFWHHPDPAVELERRIVVIPDPDGGSAETPWHIGDLIWAVAQAAGIGMAEATARVLYTPGEAPPGATR